MGKMLTARRTRIAVEFLAALILVICLHGAAITSIEQLAVRFDRFAQAPVALQIQEQRRDQSERPLIRLLPGEAPEVDDEFIEVVGFAPRRTRVQIFANDVFVGDYYVNDTGTFRRNLRLRPGLNSVLVEVSDYAPLRNSHRMRASADFSVRRIRAGDGSAPVLLASSTDQFGTRMFHGLSNAFATIEVCGTSDGRSEGDFVTADARGVFVVRSAATESIALRGAGDSATLIPGPCDPAFYPVKQNVNEPIAQHFSRRLRVTADERGSAKLEARVRLPQDSELEDLAANRLIGAREFIERLFALEIMSHAESSGRRVPDYEVNLVRVDRNESEGWAELRAELELSDITLELGSEGALDRELPPFMSGLGDSLRIELPPPLLSGFRSNPAPDAESQTETGHRRMEWTQPMKSGVFTATVRSTATERTSKLEEDDGELSEERQQQFSPVQAINLIRDILPNTVSNLGFHAIGAIPYIWFLLVLRRYRGSIAAEDWLRLHYYVVGLLVIHASYILVFFPGVDLHGWTRSMLRPWSGDGASETIEHLRAVLPGYFPALMVAAIVVVALLERIYDSAAAPPPARRWRWSLLRISVLWPVTILMAVLPLIIDRVPPSLFANATFEPEEGVEIAAVVAAVLLGGLSVYWLLRVAFRAPFRFRYALLISAAMILLPSLPALARIGAASAQVALLDYGLNPFLLGTGYQRAAWILVILAAGVALLSVIVTRTLGVAGAQLLPHWSPRLRRLAFVGLFSVVAFPASVMLGETPDQRMLVIFFGRVVWLLPFVALVGACVFLRRSNPADQFQLSDGERAAGALVFSFYLCGDTTNLLLVPIPVLLGYHLYNNYLIVRRAPLSTTGPVDQVAALSSLVALKDAEHLHGAYRRNAEKKYAEGEITREQFEAGLGTAASRVTNAQSALPMPEAALREQVFAHGPGTGPWDNARKAVLYSMPVAVLLLLASIERAFQQQDLDPFPILKVLTPIVIVAMYLIVTAFCFGYFYHVIRGRDGPSKGLAFAVAIMLPTVVVLILNATPLLGVTAGERLFRIALFVSTLALAFDLQVVRRAGFRVRHLVSIYGGAPSLAIGSSIAALGGLSLSPLLKTSGCWLLQFFGIAACGAS